MEHIFGTQLLARLQKHAQPFVDSVDDVIHRALDALEAAGAKSATLIPEIVTAGKQPDFTWSKPISITINNQSIKPEWNALLIKMVEAAAGHGLSGPEIKSLLFIPSHVGLYEGPGYKFVSKANISIQGQNSQKAWEQATRIAKHIGATIEVEWIWYNNPKAEKPGGHGKINFPQAPSQS